MVNGYNLLFTGHYCIFWIPSSNTHQVNNGSKPFRNKKKRPIVGSLRVFIMLPSAVLCLMVQNAEFIVGSGEQVLVY